MSPLTILQERARSEPSQATISAELYTQILQVMPIPCVDLVVRRGERFLLVRRAHEPARGQWWLPGGRIHKGELSVVAAARKLRHEVGLGCRVGTLVHAEETIFQTGPAGIPAHTLNVCFAAEADPEATLSLDGDHLGHGWFLARDLVGATLHPYVVNCLRAAGAL